MSTQMNVQAVKDFFSAVGRGDKQSLLALPAEHTKWIEDSAFRDDVLCGPSGIGVRFPADGCMTTVVPGIYEFLGDSSRDWDPRHLMSSPSTNFSEVADWVRRSPM